MKLNEALKMARIVSKNVEELLSLTGIEEYGYPDNIDISDISADERFNLEQLSIALASLDTFHRTIDYMSKPIVKETRLYKNNRGRYESNVCEYTSGCQIEYLTYDSFYEYNVWKLSRVEHDGENYYIVGDKDISLDGLTIRYRQR